MNNEKLNLIELKIGDELYSILKEVNKRTKMPITKIVISILNEKLQEIKELDYDKNFIENYKNINISNYKSAFSKDINTGEIQGLLADEGMNPAGFVKILNNLNYDNFLIDFFMDDPDSGYGIYALRYIQDDDSAIIIQITKENNAYKITEVINYK